MTMTRPAITISIAKPQIGAEEQAAVLEVLASGQLAQGKRVADFEERFGAWTGARHAVAVNSGTAALHLALLAHGIGPGDEVITSSFSFIASANAVLYTGATPIFADIDPDTFTLDPASIEAAITQRTKAIIVVHLFGQPCAMDAIADIATRHGLAIIEDACQAHGARLRDLPVGSWGTACYSFYPTKNMTTGEGGMVTTGDAAIADRVRLLREHGMRRRYVHEIVGFNMRMTDLHAAIGLAQLARVDGWTRRRQENAAVLDAGLRGLPGVRTPVVQSGATHVYHQYTIRVAHRDRLIEELTARGVGHGIYYPTPIHQQEAYRQAGAAADEKRGAGIERGQQWPMLPNTEAAAAEVLSLPVHPALSADDIEQIVAAVRAGTSAASLTTQGRAEAMPSA